MSQTVLDQAFLVEDPEGIARYRVVVSGTGTGSEGCALPSSPFNKQPLGVTTHGQSRQGKPIGVRAFGIIRCEAASAIKRGDEVIIGDAVGRIAAAPKASVVVGNSPTTNHIRFTSMVPGLSGNGVSVEIVPAPAGDPVEILVSGNSISIIAETSDDVSMTSTAQEIIDAVNADPVGSLLISAANETGSTGAGSVVAANASLSGGEAGEYAFGIARQSASSAGDLIDVLIK